MVERGERMMRAWWQQFRSRFRPWRAHTALEQWGWRLFVFWITLKCVVAIIYEIWRHTRPIPILNPTTLAWFSSLLFAYLILGWLLQFASLMMIVVGQRGLVRRLRTSRFCLCPDCLYDLHALSSTKNCPECGRKTSRRAAARRWRMHFPNRRRHPFWPTWLRRPHTAA
jgi:hypothetical protein